MIGKKINQLATELAPVSTDLTIIGDPVSGVSKKITLAQLGAIFSGAVSFYNDFASFPATGDINVIYCAKDTKKLYLWSGSTYVEVFPSQALLDTYQLRSEKGNANGYASLDSSGKVPISQLPSSIMEYKGTWNAATNTPTLANGTGDTGDVYLCNAAGTVNFGAGPITFAVGDYTIYSGSIWQRSSGAVGTVTSVAATITGDAIGITGSPVTTSGTLAFAFGGNSTQYINGAGNLITFPSIISQAANLVTEVYNKTGATLTKGTIVYINGGQGNLPTITKAIATGDSTSAQTFGIVQADITNNNNGYVVIAGRLSDLDTQAYTEGTQLYLSSTTAGTWTSTKQYAPAHLVYVGIVVRAHPTQGVVEVKIQNGYELDELHNVAAQTPSNNDGLFYESSTDLWKNKSIATILGYTPQAQLNGTGFVKASGTTISYDNSTYVTTDTFQNISASKTFAVGFSIASAGGTNQLTSFINTSSLFSGSAGSNVFGFNSANNIYFGKGLDNGGVFSWNNSAVRYYTLPDATGTIALVGGSGVGTVTSVAALSLGTTGTDLNSTVVDSTTTPVITLNVPTASATNRGALSSTDWSTFNNKQNALTNPVTGTGTTNYLPKFTGTSTIGNSIVQDDGTNATVGGGLTSSSFLRVNKNGSDSLGAGAFFALYNTAFTSAIFQQLNASNGLDWWNTSSKLMTLTASGNLGLGVTPSAWQSGTKALQINGGSMYASNTYTFIGSNAVYTDAGDKYINTGFATIYGQLSGEHRWYNAPSGTAGNAISFTQAMTLNASGNLSIGNTNDTYKLDVSGTGRFTSFVQSQTNFISESVTNSITVGLSTAENAKYNYLGHGGYWGIKTALTGFSFALDTYNGGTPKNVLTITQAGAATFSSSVTATQFIVGSASTSSDVSVRYKTDTGDFSTINDRGSHAFGIYDHQVSSYRMYINTSGNVGIGTTSPVAPLHVFGNLSSNPVTFEGNSSSNAWVKWKAGATSASWQLGASSGAFIFYDDLQAAERMRITSGGQVLINRTSAASSEEVLGIQAKVNTTAFDIQIGTNSYYGIRFRNSSGSQAGYIQVDASSVTYGTGSDYRLKKDLKNFNGLDLLSKIKTYDFAWNIDNSRMYGVIAHELQSVIPYAVSGTKDAYNKDGSINPQGVDYSKIVPVLIKAIQELNDKIK